MDKLNQLLQDVSKIVVEEKTLHDEKRKRGEDFNIFSVLGLSRSEVKLHSAFLAELLNPNGNHGLGEKFLKAFVDDVLPKDRGFLFYVDSAKPKVEYDIGEINEEYTEGGRIDILIQDKKRHSIIIENKIDAVDQKNQLLRYYNFITKKEGLTDDKFILLYLTPYGTKPSEVSLGKSKDVIYKCISYREDIFNWLTKCLGIAVLHPSIREIIQQYLLNLQQILNLMSEKNTQKMLDLILKDSNIEATLRILSLNKDIRSAILKKFIATSLKKLVTEKRMTILDDKDFYELNNRNNNNRHIHLIFSDYPRLSFTLEQIGTKVVYGVYTKDNPNRIIMPASIEGWVEPNEGFPYGHNDFEGNLCYWDSDEALLDMTKGEEGEIYKKIDEETSKIINGGYLQRLNDLL